MTKADFLESLRRALNGNMSAASVEDNIQYYNSYFSGQEAQGRSEADVLNELGNPRILARTLIDAAERAGDTRAHEANETQYRTAGSRMSGSGASGYAQGSARQNRFSQEHAFRNASQNYGNESWTSDEGMREHSVFRVPGWLILVAVILILFVVIRVVGSLVWILLPYAIPVILVVYIVKLIGRK
ncbi:MAG TPA: DUF1700 domain-containing protein [Candidatus Eisenbergiella merdipullorum]|uniref:DUF1700 domain-containing protein n=1 Tax=Candidatus Eisenbergiella merdipullorum TaxID=2838553 RepID=A0A9D2I5H5_9FIRM|nr:DUF1700 domain-containing protein [Candidatus Eisenbergiella merdipullorum]